ncbi:unnamed protein product [Miscanthus lutarioriparius]|uniref:F-box domain-containing protein n=1 Tax=Miscanthus lutarioriparius TaxID=422564 RepID=A0A811RC96_9POAL|nr:unnamed protein product [Miscanthus lutarioriparius]
MERRPVTGSHCMIRWCMPNTSAYDTVASLPSCSLVSPSPSPTSLPRFSKQLSIHVHGNNKREKLQQKHISSLRDPFLGRSLHSSRSPSLPSPNRPPSQTLATDAPPPPPPPPDPEVLIDELVEEFLLRLPPEDPALLARAALVSRQWYRVVTGPSFRRRFRELYRSTPLLGYVLNLADSIRFVPLSSFRPPRTRRRGVRAVSSSHGRVLLHRLSGEDLVAPGFPVKDVDVLLSVWHPITDEQQDLPVVPLRPTRYPNTANWDAAVICSGGDGCDHLHCHFKVVFVGNCEDRNFSCFYSSEAGPGVPPDIMEHSSRLVAAEDGSLGFARASNSTLGLWLRENAADALPDPVLEPSEAILAKPLVIAFADTGAGVIFLWTRAGYFTIDLKSGSCKKVGEVSSAPGAVSTDDRPETGVAISTYEVPVADIAVSTDKGPGAGVAVSANEGPGAAGMCQMPKKPKLQVQGPLNQEGN